MLLVKSIDNHFIDIVRHVIAQNIHVKVQRFQCDTEKIHENHDIILIFLKLKHLVLRKFQCILSLNSSFDGGLFYNFYFDTIMTYFTFFILYVR
jgi:hypothetical protein